MLTYYKMNLVYYIACFFPVFTLFILIIIYSLKNGLIAMPPSLQLVALPKVMVPYGLSQQFKAEPGDFVLVAIGFLVSVEYCVSVRFFLYP